MTCKIGRFGDGYEIGRRYEFANGDEPEWVCFNSLTHAQRILYEFILDRFAIHNLRCLLSDAMKIGVQNLDDHEVIEEMAKLLDRGSYVMARLPALSWEGFITPAQVKKPKEEPEEEEEEELSWIQVKVVDDQSGVVIPRVKLTFKFANGEERELSTGIKGLIDLRDIPEGSCEVGCNIKGITLDNCMHFVTLGEDASGQKENWEEELVGQTKGGEFLGTRIAIVEGRKVKTGDTLASLAQELGMTAEELSEFNWGVRAPTAIAERLAFYVGCTKRGQDGESYDFDDQDQPGFIFLPQAWSEQLDTAKTHTIRVKPAGYYLRFNYHINVDDPDNQDDTITLQSPDGIFQHVIEVSKLEEVEPDWVELVFPKPPTGMRYDLIQDPKDGQDPFYTFQNAEEEDFFPPPEPENEDQQADDEPEEDNEDFWDFD